MPDQHPYTALMVIGALVGATSVLPAFLARERSRRRPYAVAALATQVLWWWLFRTGVGEVNFSDSGGMAANIFGWLLLETVVIPLLLAPVVFTAVGVTMGVDRLHKRRKGTWAPRRLRTATMTAIIAPAALWIVWHMWLFFLPVLP